MMNAAKGTSNVYTTENMRYSDKDGFTDWDLEKWNTSAFDYINDIFEFKWELAPVRKMTLEEIERELGCKVEIVQKSY